METEQRLSAVLSDFARNLVIGFSIQDILDHLVVSIVDMLPVTAAGVSLITPDEPTRFLATSDSKALRYEELQADSGDGPCLVACRTGELVEVPDLAADDRFPSFGPAAVGQGLAAVFTFPLRHGDRCLGALDLYRSTAGPMDAEATRAAQTLADVTAAYIVNEENRSVLAEASRRAQRDALHDPLTGLPNRTLLTKRLEHAVLRSRRSGGMVAILFADLDRFKQINDEYGHHVGDQALAAVAIRLTALVRPGDTLARLAGDEFVIVCEDLHDADEVEALADRIGVALAEAFVLSGTEIRVTASVGIAFAGPGDDIPEQILHDADQAMYEAKQLGRARHHYVDRIRGGRSPAAGLRRSLIDAMASGELRNDYQPVVRSTDRHIVRVEALLRWPHPSAGAITSATVVALAEEHGMLAELGRWALEQSCLDRQAWLHGSDVTQLQLSVNVSVRQLLAPEFAAIVRDVLAATSTDPAEVVLDVRESIFIRDPDDVATALRTMKDLGLSLALDNFGSGYSSLGHLRRFPIDIVKLDRTFVTELDREDASRIIAGSVIELAHRLAMTVVAVGVESAAIADELAALGCDAQQGFHFGQPMPAGELAALLPST